MKGSEEAAEWPLGAGQAGAPAPPGATYPTRVRLLVADSCEPTWRCCQRGQPSCQGTEPAPRPGGSAPPRPGCSPQPAAGETQAPHPTQLPAGRSSGCPRSSQLDGALGAHVAPAPTADPPASSFPSPTANTKPLSQALLLGEPNKTAGSSSKKDRSGCPSGSAGMGVWKSGYRRNDGTPCPGTQASPTASQAPGPTSLLGVQEPGLLRPPARPPPEA